MKIGSLQRRLGSKEDHSTTKGNYKTDLTLTGLLMEGLSARLYKPLHSRQLIYRNHLDTRISWDSHTILIVL